MSFTRSSNSRSIVNRAGCSLGVLALLWTSACSSTEQAEPLKSTDSTIITGQVPTTGVGQGPDRAQLIDGWSVVGSLPTTGLGVTITASASDGSVHVMAICHRLASSIGTSGAAAIWWATDIERWELASLPDTDRCMSQIEHTPFGFFASGGGKNLWSLDGRVWETFKFGPDGPVGSPNRPEFETIFLAPDRSRLTLVKFRLAPGEATIASLLTTTDGTTWVDGPDASQFDNTTIRGVRQTGEAMLAFGASPGGESEPTAAIFRSSDGLNWERVTPYGPDFENKDIFDIIETNKGFVAVGRGDFGTGQMVAWTSPDGITWLLSPHPSEPVDASGGYRTAESITQTEGVLWAAGNDQSTPVERPALWTSDDGVDWARVEFEDDADPIPFTVLTTADQMIGVWPPAGMPLMEPLRIFVSDR